MNEISYPEALKLDHPYFIDIRSPVEYSKDHIPGSVNMPLFNDHERSEIGKIYRLIGKDEAVVKGVEIVGGKIGDIVANIKKIRDKDIVIYCFRGGMRSSSLISLLNSLEFPVLKLRGGYKGYRSYVRSIFQNLKIIPGVFVLHGLTGTGKTEIIGHIKNSIDLEKSAGHRSSVFGGIGLRQHSQKLFESLIVKKINDLNKKEFLVIEGESRKIGNLHVPENLIKVMHKSPGILIEASLDRRIEILMNEYSSYDLDHEEVLSIVRSLSNRLGKRNTDLLTECFERGDLFEFIRILLEKYYDPLYKHSLKKMKFIARIENSNSAISAKEVEKVVDHYLNTTNV